MKLKKRVGIFSFRKLVLAAADIFIFAIAALLSNYILAVFKIGSVHTSTLTLQIFVMAVIGFFTMWVCGAYTKMWRYFKLKDYASCVLGTTIAFAVNLIMAVAGVFYANAGQANLYWFIAVEFLLACTGVILFRLIFRRTFLTIVKAGESAGKSRTLLVGAGKAGKIIIKEVNDAAQANEAAQVYNIVGIVDDNPRLTGAKVLGIPVLGRTDKIQSVCESEEIDTILMAIPSCGEEDRRRILSECSKTPCHIKVIPYVSNLIFDEYEDGKKGNDRKGRTVISQMNDINVNDLLGRPPISFDKTPTKELIKGRVCMVTEIGRAHV